MRAWRAPPRGHAPAKNALRVVRESRLEKSWICCGRPIARASVRAPRLSQNCAKRRRSPSRKGRPGSRGHSPARQVRGITRSMSRAARDGRGLGRHAPWLHPEPGRLAVGTGMNRLAEDLGFIVAYPRQSATADHSACWNWFNLQDRGARNTGGAQHHCRHHARDHGSLPSTPGASMSRACPAGGAMAAIMGRRLSRALRRDGHSLRSRLWVRRPTWPRPSPPCAAA